MRSRQGRARHIAALAFPVQYGNFCFANQKKSARKRAKPPPKAHKGAQGRFARALQQPAAGEPKRPRSAAQGQGGWL